MGRRRRGSRPAAVGKKRRERFVRRRLGIETLEPRHVLSAANLVISEFMAANSDTLADGDGRFSDWIEIQNAGATTVNLADYRLTDTPGDLERWAFPSSLINPGEYLVVFASSPSDGAGGTLNNYVDAGGYLHTNFSLDADGEYLALTYEDPATHVVSMVHEYAAEFPPQRSDISYGIAQIANELSYVTPGAAAQTIVPTNDGYDAVWSSPNYTPDGNWTSGTTGIGYGQTASGFLVRMYEANLSQTSPIGNTLDNIDEALEVIGNPAARFSLRAGNFATVNFLNTGSGPVTGHYAGDLAFPGQTNPTNYNHFATHSRAVVTIPAAGDWTFGIRSNEGFYMTLGAFEMQRSGTDSNDQDVMATFNFAAAGTYDLNLYHFEGTGDAWLELFAAQGAHAVWDAGAFDLVGDVANGGLAVTSDIVGSSGASISQLLGTNVHAQMAGANSTFYTRIRFTIDSLADYDQLKLRVKYDDAFVAYLNGVEIARRNVSGATDWDSTANLPRVTDDVLTYEEIDVSLFASSLHVGSNLLAIHGINFSSSDPDALIMPELVAVDQIGTSAGYFATPTPRAANGNGFVGFVEDVTASAPRGFYDAPIDVSFTTTTAGAEIRYTLDGTEPTATYGVVYSGPVHIAQTSIVRAAAFEPGFFASPVSTHTYIFLNDVIRQSPNGEAPPGFPTTPINGQVNDYGMDPDIVNSPVWGPQLLPALKALPTLSLVTPPAHLFDQFTGIWVNANRQGLAWEREGSLELINPPDGANPFGTSEFQIDMGLRIRGEFSRTPGNPKHGFRLFFRDDIGGELRYEWFGEEGADVFEKMDLRVAQNWNWHLTGASQYTYTRDVGARDLQGDLGEPYTRSRFYHMYINGQYWGIYQTEERPDDFYGETYFGGEESNYDVMKVDDDATVFATAGNGQAWGQFYSLLNTLPQAATQAERHNIVMQLQGLNSDGTRNPAYPVHLDVENLIDFMLVVNIWGSRDSPINPDGSQVKNFFAIRDRTGERGWQFFLHDVEWGILVQFVQESRAVPFSMGNTLATFHPQWAHQQLMYSDEYRLLFADYVQKYFFNKGPMTPANMIARHQRRVDELPLAMIAESARWGDRLRSTPYTRDNWLANVEHVKNNFFMPRTNIVLEQFKSTVLLTGGSAPLFPSINAPVFSNYGGDVSAGYVLTISKPVGTPAGAEIFYTLDGSDPRLVGGAANPAAVHGNGPFNITINESTQIKARIRSGTTWSAVIDATLAVPGLLPLRITELHYDPADYPGVPDGNDLEFIEVMNAGTIPVDMEGVQITQFVNVPYTFPADIALAPGERIVVAKNPAAFRSVYGSSVRVAAGDYGSGNLSNGGEPIALVGPLGEVLQEFEYDDADPWPAAAGGGGYSLEIIDPLGDATNPSNWRASYYYGGSPGGDGQLRLGDYDRNGVVNQQDYQRWRESYGLSVPPGMGADGNGNGTVDTADFVLWRRGIAASPPAALTASAAVTDPVTATTPHRAAEAKDRAVAALYHGGDESHTTTRGVVRMRPALRPSAATGIAGRPASQLLLDMALFEDASHDAGIDSLRTWFTVDYDGDPEAREARFRVADDVPFKV
jgi:hypothetical protein